MLRNHIDIAKPADTDDLPYVAVKVAYIQTMTPPPPKPALAETIKVRTASYGYAPSFCEPTAIRQTIVNLCDGKKSCPIDVQNYLCGSDPKPGARKVLRVDYSCGETSKTAQGNDDQKMVLACP
jgi:hypothetical protein